MRETDIPGVVAATACNDQHLFNLPTPEVCMSDSEWSALEGPSPPFFTDYGHIDSKRQPDGSLHSPHSIDDDTLGEWADDARCPRSSLSTPRSDPNSFRTASVMQRTPSIECHRQSNHQRHSPSRAVFQPHQPAHSCYDLASKALETLRLENRYGCPKRRNVDSPLPPLNLDNILEVNKSALAMLQQTLNCRCSERHTPLAFLYTSIISKVIFWYEVAGRIIRSVTAPAEGAGRFPSSSRSPPANDFCPRSLDSLPISIGGFDIDAEDRATLSRLLLLSEMRKTAGIVERLRSRWRESSEGGLYDMLGNWLAAESTRTIREVKSIGDTSDRSMGAMADRRSWQHYLRA
jgi:hypothetical protein